jgi:hypothetical protein
MSLVGTRRSLNFSFLVSISRELAGIEGLGSEALTRSL